ncbi:MAG TPA: protein-L-isoaspartate(D-aspartate) O-methyltransferase [Candidatus Solibacter sp.]|jgi:protein-L-isoaspartate(D-aspartate) O-methyltransferase|nr:protein-L-isoaspartate(D-aspartate) O-methyltransferase [Candidatus Solibacter sp.]
MSSGPQEPFNAERLSMVEQQLRKRGIHDERVLGAMKRVPRHEFVPHQNWPEAYADHPIAIGEQQTTSQPYMIAAMLQAAEIEPQDRVLEIGAGSGYQTALLAELASQVFAIERYPTLVEQARHVLERLGYTNITLVPGDGTLGLPEAAPFNAIVVSAAAPQLPPALIEQLAVGGRLVIPVGDVSEQVLQVVEKQPDGITVRSLEGCRFVPLIGQQGFAA